MGLVIQVCTQIVFSIGVIYFINYSKMIKVRDEGLQEFFDNQSYMGYEIEPIAPVVAEDADAEFTKIQAKVLLDHSLRNSKVRADSVATNTLA